MEIKGIEPHSPPQPAAPIAPDAGASDPRVDPEQRVPPPEETQADNKTQGEETQADNKALGERRNQPPDDRGAAPRPAIHRLELRIDDATHEVFGRVVDSETGESVREIPSQELRRVYAQLLEQLGPLVDETA